MNHHALDRDGMVIRTEPGFTVVRVEHANVIFQVDELNYTNDSGVERHCGVCEGLRRRGKADCGDLSRTMDAGGSSGPVEGKTLTSWPSLRTDIGNAGGQWRD